MYTTFYIDSQSYFSFFSLRTHCTVHERGGFLNIEHLCRLTGRMKKVLPSIWQTVAFQLMWVRVG